MWIKVAMNETIRNMITLRLSMYTPSGKVSDFPASGSPGMAPDFASRRTQSKLPCQT